MHMDNNEELMVTLTDSDQVMSELEDTVSGLTEAEALTITVDKEAGIYELQVDGQTAAGLLFTESGSRVVIRSTAVFRDFRGRGIAGKLLGGVLDQLRSEGRTATLTCPFGNAFVRSHPEYDDVVDRAFPGAPHEHREAPDNS